MLMQLIEENQSFGHIGVVCHPVLRRIIRNVSLLPLQYKSYALHPNTHVDFLLYNRVGKKPILAIEVDGYSFHKSGTKQSHRDTMKDEILKLYGIPLLRLSTIGSGEKKQIVDRLMSL
jgi:very-short-patch-repair endonuclease